MARPTSINQPIVETLYAQALVLADEVRACFGLDAGGNEEARTDSVRIALSIEGLRATTRMMHLLAWLLNQRAFFDGELSEAQLLRTGALPEDRPHDSINMKLLEPATCALLEETRALHARVARLDRAWRDGFAGSPDTIGQMHRRLGRALARG